MVKTFQTGDLTGARRKYKCTLVSRPSRPCSRLENYSWCAMRKVRGTAQLE